jgi:hypothetical protein
MLLSKWVCEFLRHSLKWRQNKSRVGIWRVFADQCFTSAEEGEKVRVSCEKCWFDWMQLAAIGLCRAAVRLASKRQTAAASEERRRRFVSGLREVVCLVGADGWSRRPPTPSGPGTPKRQRRVSPFGTPTRICHSSLTSRRLR